MAETRSRTPLFLIELTIMILAFSFFAAVGLRLFSSARQTSEYAGDLGLAVAGVQTAADIFKSVGGDMDKTATALSASLTGDKLVVYYDSAWEPTSLSDAYFVMTVTENGGLAKISASLADGGLLYSLEVRAVTHG